MRAFVDSSGFLAFMLPRDVNHRRAVDVWDKINTAAGQLITTNYVVVETAALLHARFGAQAMRGFLQNVLPMVMVQWVDLQLHLHGVSAVEMSGRNGPNIVDCVSFAAMRKLDIEHALTFDHHFDEQGFRRL